MADRKQAKDGVRRLVAGRFMRVELPCFMGLKHTSSCAPEIAYSGGYRQNLSDFSAGWRSKLPPARGLHSQREGARTGKSWPFRLHFTARVCSPEPGGGGGGRGQRRV